MDMNTKKYKSVVVNRETYEIISNLAEKTDRSISGTILRLITNGMSAEAEEANIDSELVGGGTPRLKRLVGDLEWFRTHAGMFLNIKEPKKKRYIIDVEESRALDVTLATVFDCGG